MATTFRVTVLTPERTAFEGEAVHLLAPGAEGYLGVLAHHAPLITSLQPGRLAVRIPDEVQHHDPACLVERRLSDDCRVDDRERSRQHAHAKRERGDHGQRQHRRSHQRSQQRRKPHQPPR